MKPAPGYVLGNESPIDVDEEQRASGLIVKREHNDYEYVKRAVVIEVGEAPIGMMTTMLEQLEPGSIVFYTSQFAIGDNVLIAVTNIVAYD